MTREPTIPLFLWICAAICTHIVFAGGGEYVGIVHEDKSYLARMAAVARDRVRMEEATFEVGLDGLGKPTDPQETPPPPPPPPPPPVAEKTPPPKAPPPPKKDAPKEEEKKVAVVVKPEEPKHAPPPPEPKDQRIAVRQHAKPNQEDNPNARFIGDEANHVEQETVATQTSHDRDEENPTPGGNHAGPQDKVGDSDRTKIAESEEHAGDKNRAPGEKGTEFEVQKDPMPQTPPGKVAIEGPKTPQAPATGGDGRQAQTAPQEAPPQLAPGGAAPASPEVTESPNGGWAFNPTRPNAGTGASPDPAAGTGSRTPAPWKGPSPTAWLGLGGKPGAGQLNLNLSQTGVVAAVGQDQLRKEREADGERRRSEHRGAWLASNFERWRSAIENYVSTVKPGNQTALNTAAVPFATYLNGMHNRIHPLFADAFLESLDGLPKQHPLNDPKLITKLEIVLTRDGHVMKMGIVKTSGVTAFDIAALDSVQRASPFGKAPAAIVSPDGNVYLHWEFHRDEVFACSTMNARPFLLNAAPPGPPAEPEPPGKAPPPTQERGLPPVNTSETREGHFVPPVAVPERAGKAS